MEIATCATLTKKRHGLGTKRFIRFSSLTSLQHAISNLIVVARKFRCPKELGKTHSPTTEGRLRNPTVNELEQAMNVILRAVQEEAFGEIPKSEHPVHTRKEESPRVCPSKKKRTMKKLVLFRLDPFISDDGLLRVGGRLQRARLEYRERHPILLPKGHHVLRLTVRHYHNQVRHQGRQIMHGAIRQAGYWLLNGNLMVAKELSLCVVRQKLGGPPPLNNGWLTYPPIG